MTAQNANIISYQDVTDLLELRTLTSLHQNFHLQPKARFLDLIRSHIKDINP